MGLEGKKVFIRKSGDSHLYKWSPQGSPADNKNNKIKLKAETCTAQAYQTNGDDNITNYVSNPERINDILIHNAYVECDYVQ
jgi:hypothetical protein